MAFSVASTLEKMNSRDKDFRYMATADLVTELGKDSFKMDADSEKKITTSVLKLLEDNSNQVQELAVKCLGPLSKKVKEAHVADIVDTLCNHLLTEKKGTEELRDISSIGLKTVITEVPVEPATLSSLLVKRLTPRLVNGISANEDKPETVTYCLEALNELLGKFGSQMVSDHASILKVIQPQLNAKRPAARKKAIGCLGHLAVSIPDTLFAELVNSLITNLNGSAQQKQEQLRTYIQAIGAISRSVGYRLGRFLKEIVPTIIKFGGDVKLADDELRENCFQCFESLILRCPKEITPFLEDIIKLCLQFIKYDPNYAADDEDEEGENGDDMDTSDNDNDEEDDDDADQEDYSDDDDMSWKVRRAAVKCLSAVITTRPELLSDMYARVAPALITRFLEREENVKLDVFNTFEELLRQTAVFSRRHPELKTLTDPLRTLTPKIVSGITKQLKEKSLKTRSGAFTLLKELVHVLPGVLSDQIAPLVPGIVLSLGDKSTNSNLKIDTLVFLRLLLASHPASAFHPHIKSLAGPVFKAVRDSYYRISAEALRVCCELVRVLRPVSGEKSFDFRPYVGDLFQATLEKLKTQDIDQEVKESAITCMGLILANLGDELKSQTPEVLNILLDRLSNEITRITAVKAFETIAQSPYHLDLSTVLPETLKELSTFLRKANRQLKQSSLLTLTVLVRNYGKNDPRAAELFRVVLSELSPLISDSDLHLTHLALSLTTEILRANPASAPLIGEQILPKALDLLRSTLLQGLALDSLLALFSEVVKANISGLTFESLLDRLLAMVSPNNKGTEGLPKQVLSNIAKAIASLTVSVDDSRRNATVKKFLTDLDKKDELPKHLALFALGEIGRKADLSGHSSLAKDILSSFHSTNEETRQAASFALGNVTVGNLSVYVPLVLSEIKGNPSIKYLLLHSLREIILRQSSSSQGVEALRNYEKDILPILFTDCENAEEGTRNVVAECLGKLALVTPTELVPTLAQHATSPNALTRSTIVTALKFAIVDKPQPIDSLLAPHMARFLELLKDQDLNVRRNTLLTLNYAAHNKPLLIRDLLPNYLPLVYGESKVKPELIREVDLGPFKHKVDDGLEIRKAAFECMYTLLDSSLDRINIPAFITNLVDGLKDHYDIKMLTHLMLIRLSSSVAGAALLEGLDQLVEPLRATIATKPKEGAVKQEIERNEELIRSTLRAVVAINRIPNADSNVKWEEFMRTSVKTPELAEKYNAIKTEVEHNEGAQNLDAMDLS